MTQPTLPSDPLWPRAATWLLPFAENPGRADLAIIGVPAHATSITPTGARMTPMAVREALLRYSTYATSRGVDVATLRAVDFGDVSEPDGDAGEARVRDVAAQACSVAELVLAIGGDNSITYSLASALLRKPGLANAGLITVDAHHDLRDGRTNGSPVRRLLEAGMPGSNVVQIGIADFANSPEYAARAQEHGISVVPRASLRGCELRDVVRRALEVAGADHRPVFVDLDVDVCDRSAVPGCPSAAPGGISADELRELAYLFAADPRVCGMDITEVDATTDAADGRTVRLAALLVLEAAAGLHARLNRA